MGKQNSSPPAGRNGKRGNPGWQKGGESPNPGGRPPLHPPPRARAGTGDAARIEDRLDGLRDQLRGDGWMSLQTAMGTVRDKRQSYLVQPTTTVNTDTAIDLWRSNDIASKIIEVWPEEMLREGFDLDVPGEETDLQTDVHGVWDDLELNDALYWCSAWKRAFGGGATIYGTLDGAENISRWSTPLDIDRVTDVQFLNFIEPQFLTPKERYSEPREAKYGKVKIWELASTTGERNSQPIQIHESRLSTFSGKKVTRGYLSGVLPGWGDNTLTAAHEVLRDFGLTWANAAALIEVMSLDIIKMDKLADMVGRGKNDIFVNRMTAIDMFRSNFRLMLLDKQEDFERKSVNLSQLPEMMTLWMQRTAAVADIPVTRLFGISPGGLNATGDSDVRFFYDRVKAAQGRELTSTVETVTRFVFKKLGAEEPLSWDITYRPLWQPTEKERADTHLTQSTADVNYIREGVIRPIDVTKSRFSSARFSLDTNVDIDEIEDALKIKTGQAKKMISAGVDENGLPVKSGGEEEDDDEEADIVEDSKRRKYKSKGRGKGRRR